MVRFLLNANISPKTAEFLNSLGCDAKTVEQFGLGGAEDIEIAKKAVEEKRIIVTMDSDFGEIYYFAIEKEIWVIVLKLRNQTVESVNKNLDWLLKTKILEKKEFRNTLMMIGEGKIKIRKRP